MRTQLGRTARLLVFLFSAACGATSEDASTSEDAITDVPHTAVKEQAIGNCWLYASVAWAESLHRSAANETVDLSESYLSYWHWYEQLARAGETPTLETGGFFREATHLMSTYGLMDEASFIAADAARPSSTRQKDALARVNEAIKPEGRLAKVEQRTPKNIRAVLDEAFELAPEVRTDLRITFGDDAPRPLTKERAVPARILSPFTFAVTSKAPGAAATTSTLDAVIPQWEEANVYGDGAAARGPMRRLQKTLHDALPAIIVWHVDFASSQNDGAFRRRPTSRLDKWDGSHMTVVEDYQAANVPGYGTLAAGATITDAATLSAALAEQSSVSFVRIKNSWGFRPAPAGSEELKGYFDLYDDYLFGMHALTSVIVPVAYDASAPAGQVDVCSAGGRQRTGTFCAKGITGDVADKRVVVCTAGVSTGGQVCEQGCAEQAAGVPDACVDGGGAPAPPPPNPCKTGGARSPGKYCGASLRLAANDPGFAHLYSCQKDTATGEWLSPSIACGGGCKVQPSGVPDSCR